MHNKPCLGFFRGYCGWHKSDCCNNPSRIDAAGQPTFVENSPVKQSTIERAAKIRGRILEFLQAHGGDVHSLVLKEQIAPEFNIHHQTVYWHLLQLLKRGEVMRVKVSLYRAVQNKYSKTA